MRRVRPDRFCFVPVIRPHHRRPVILVTSDRNTKNESFMYTRRKPIRRQNIGVITMHEPSVTSPDSPGIILRPVGIIRNRIRDPFLIADQDGISMRGGLEANKDRIRSSEGAISEIILNEDVAGALDGIEEYSHLMVLYWGHRIPEESRLLTRVHPMGRKEIPAVGIFSTCSPARPNPVLMTAVRLHARRGNVLEVAGLDAVDGSPVIDIKPYVPEQVPKEGVRIPAWMEQLMREVGSR